jgi:hypothetical protein
MYLCISGFLPNNSDDDLIKFELDVDGSFNDKILKVLGHKSLNSMAEGEWLLTDEQITLVSGIIGQALPSDLKLLIGVEA